MHPRRCRASGPWCRSARQAAAAVAGLPADEYPNLTDAPDEFSEAIAGWEQFEYGLERILDGLEARLQSIGGATGATSTGSPSSALAPGRARAPRS